jgi:hypothetical protein
LYDLLLFGIVRKSSLTDLGLSPEEVLTHPRRIDHQCADDRLAGWRYCVGNNGRQKREAKSSVCVNPSLFRSLICAGLGYGTGFTVRHITMSAEHAIPAAINTKETFGKELDFVE